MMDSPLRDRLFAARSLLEAAHALAALLWAGDHDGEPLPGHITPTLAGLKAGVASMNDDEADEFLRRHDAAKDDIQGLPAITWRHAEEMHTTPVIHLLDGAAMFWAALAAAGDPPGHPLGPVVRAFLRLPVLTEVDPRTAGIMPAAASARALLASLRRADPADSGNPLKPHFLRADPDDQLWLPDTGTEGAPAFILAVLDAGSASRRSPGAPLRDRFFAELLMAPARRARIDGMTHRLHGLTIADAVEWADWTRRHYRPDHNDYGMAISRAFAAVNTLKLPLNDRGGWLIPVFVQAIGGHRLEDPIAAEVLLPEDSGRGARIDRAVLRQAGRVSAVAWRLYLAMAFEWGRISHQGKTPHLTRPEVLRDGRGRLLDQEGRLISSPDPSRRKPGRGDRPATDWRDSRAVETGQREPSPGADLYRTYDSPAELVRTIWPIHLPPGARTHPGRTEKQAIAGALWLAGEAELSTLGWTIEEYARSKWHIQRHGPAGEATSRP